MYNNIYVWQNTTKLLQEKNRVHSQNDQRETSPRPGNLLVRIFLAAGGVVEKYIDPRILDVAHLPPILYDCLAPDVFFFFFFRYRFPKFLYKEKIKCPDSQNLLAPKARQEMRIMKFFHRTVSSRENCLLRLNL